MGQMLEGLSAKQCIEALGPEWQSERGTSDRGTQGSVEIDRNERRAAGLKEFAIAEFAGAHVEGRRRVEVTHLPKHCAQRLTRNLVRILKRQRKRIARDHL